MGRFINADDYASTGQGVIGNNTFVYCLNNPITFVDDFGSRACARDASFESVSRQKKENIVETILNAMTGEPANPITVSAGLTGNGTYCGLGFGIAGYVSVDSTHTYAIQQTTSKIVSYGTNLSGAIGLNITITNAKYVTDLDGKSMSGGFTITPLCGISLDYVTFVPSSDPSVTNFGISFTIAIGAGAGVQSAQSYTKTRGTWNPLKVLKNALFGG